MINNTDPRSFSRCPIAVRDTSTRWSTSDSLPAKGPGISNALVTSIESFIGSYPRSTDPRSQQCQFRLGPGIRTQRESARTI